MIKVWIFLFSIVKGTSRRNYVKSDVTLVLVSSEVPLTLKKVVIIFEIIELDRQNLVFLTSLSRGIQKSWLFLKLTMPSFIIHDEWHIVVLVSNKSKWLKFGISPYFRLRNSFTTFVAIIIFDGLSDSSIKSKKKIGTGVHL